MILISFSSSFHFKTLIKNQNYFIYQIWIFLESGKILKVLINLFQLKKKIKTLLSIILKLLNSVEKSGGQETTIQHAD